MASLLLPPPTTSPLFSRSAFPTPTARFSPARCELTDAVNGKPRVPVLNDQTLPKYLQSRRLGNAVDKNINNEIKIFSGTGNFMLSQEIAKYMGLNLGSIRIKRFADGEIYVQLQESVRGCDVYLVQPTCPPANENLMELLIMIDACRRASAKNITAVIPYFGYARADRKTQGRESISAKLVANLITEAGADRVLACDIHSGQSMGYFDIPVDHVYCQICSGDLVVVSPDVGGVARARAFAKKLSDAPLAIVDKRRSGHNVAECPLKFLMFSAIATNWFLEPTVSNPKILPFPRTRPNVLGAGVLLAKTSHCLAHTAQFSSSRTSLLYLRVLTSETDVGIPNIKISHDVQMAKFLLQFMVMNLIGDVKGKVAVMLDDMIDTAGTIAKGAELLHDVGAREVYACSTHAVFSPPAIERLSSGLFHEVIVTNTLPVSEENYFPQLTVLSVANLMGETIRRVHDDCSVSSIFQ
ncbi:hypothetical protein SASPL_130538 [Salvia splendens]|uniref:ribose-phosphate diphosphokinase n=1 Tax=Salvia splendens TaxID=180675 RepID=A0A8X8ZK09_SALSN|nr:hypothetical protein SASPL_130538 [Salvia splendens]